MNEQVFFNSRSSARVCVIKIQFFTFVINRKKVHNQVVIKCSNINTTKLNVPSRRQELTLRQHFQQWSDKACEELV